MSDKPIPDNVLPFVRPASPPMRLKSLLPSGALAHPDVKAWLRLLDIEDRKYLDDNCSVFVWAEFAADQLTHYKHTVTRLLHAICGAPGYGPEPRWQEDFCSQIAGDNADKLHDLIGWLSGGNPYRFCSMLSLAPREMRGEVLPEHDCRPTAESWYGNINRANRASIGNDTDAAAKLAAGHLIGAARRVIWLHTVLHVAEVLHYPQSGRYIINLQDLPPLTDDDPPYPVALRRLLPSGKGSNIGFLCGGVLW